MSGMECVQFLNQEGTGRAGPIGGQQGGTAGEVTVTGYK